MTHFIFKVDENIILRPLRFDDAQALFELVRKNKQSLAKWLPWVDSIKTVDDEVTHITNAAQSINDGTKFEMGIFTKQGLQSDKGELTNWRVIGTCGLVEIKSNCGWVGYWLDKDYRGKGIVTKACKTLAKDVANMLNLKELKMHISPQNNASLSVAKRAGFVSNNKVVQADVYGMGNYIDAYLFVLKVL